MHYNDHTSNTKILFSHTIFMDDIPYLTIVGSSQEQGFLCVPEYYISCVLELSIESTDSNMKRLESAGFSNKAALEIISHVNEWIASH